ncbi:uncharacterized protein N7482_005531 [Penicillium canariense]|uniref:Uncharacterized protein n=1 Tax=Penicillium canariense TaxID=189055 RepID=A0A9W9LNA6_9EURO|nr:uncharacterized protein N7482_005531 [Penicillium canariense]KAJ5166750.1 hypothetical protein N7482_005531 [Penicillium canariense]
MTFKENAPSDADSCEDNLMAQANQQLARELLQSQASTLAACLASQHVVPLGSSPGYVRIWTAADAFQELYQYCLSATGQLRASEGVRWGFIKYEKRTSRATIANAGTPLSIDAVGFTIKDAHNHLVGHHGDGLKLTALVLSLNGYLMSMAPGCCI